MQVLKLILCLLILILLYCIIIWYSPELQNSFDTILGVTFHAELADKVQQAIDEALIYYENIVSWIHNPAPNTSENIQGRNNFE